MYIKNEMCHMAVTIVAQIVNYYAADMLKDANAAYYLHCQ